MFSPLPRRRTSFQKLVMDASAASPAAAAAFLAGSSLDASASARTLVGALSQVQGPAALWDDAL